MLKWQFKLVIDKFNYCLVMFTEEVKMYNNATITDWENVLKPKVLWNTV